MENNSKNFIWTEELIQQHLDNKDYQELNIKDKNRNTGFMWACIHHPELAETMLGRDNINFNTQDSYGNTGFMKACVHQHQLARIILKKDNIDFNLQNNFGETGFMLACRFQSQLSKTMLKREDIELNVQDQEGAMLKLMLENSKIDKELRDEAGLTGYDIAQEHNPESLEIYDAWLTEQEKNSIKSQVQKRIKKTSQHL